MGKIVVLIIHKICYIWNMSSFSCVAIWQRQSNSSENWTKLATFSPIFSHSKQKKNSFPFSLCECGKVNRPNWSKCNFCRNNLHKIWNLKWYTQCQLWFITYEFSENSSLEFATFYLITRISPPLFFAGPTISIYSIPWIPYTGQMVCCRPIYFHETVFASV